MGADDPVAAQEDLRRVLTDLAPGAVAARPMVQVHGAEVRDADGVGDPVECDGQVTDVTGVALVVRVADCVPVLLADPDAGVIGVAHAGRKGVAEGVVPRTVERMRARGAGQMTAWLGPHICGGCYEVPHDLQEEIVAIEHATRASTRWGTPSLDLGAGVRAQLDRAGVEVVTDAVRCTRESPDLYSYRRDGAAAGRQAGLICIGGAG